MKLASPRIVRDLLTRHGLGARKSLGQNFLTDGNTLRRIADAADIQGGEPVLEIGPGLGSLTQELAARAARVLSVEIDRGLMPVLQETLEGLDNVSVVFGDFLKMSLPELLGDSKKWKVVANLPYYITTPILFRILDHSELIERMVFLVQKEVAQRAAAPPGNKVYGALSVALQHRCNVRIGGMVPPTVFIPPPKVESAILVLEPKERPYDEDWEKIFRALVETAFRFRRKTLGNAWSRLATEIIPPSEIEGVWHNLNLDPGRRGESLSVQEFEAVATYLAARRS